MLFALNQIYLRATIADRVKYDNDTQRSWDDGRYANLLFVFNQNNLSATKTDEVALAISCSLDVLNRWNQNLWGGISTFLFSRSIK